MVNIWKSLHEWIDVFPLEKIDVPTCALVSLVIFVDRRNPTNHLFLMKPYEQCYIPKIKLVQIWCRIPSIKSRSVYLGWHGTVSWPRNGFGEHQHSTDILPKGSPVWSTMYNTEKKGSPISKGSRIGFQPAFSGDMLVFWGSIFGASEKAHYCKNQIPFGFPVCRLLWTKTQQKTVLVDEHSHNHRYNYNLHDIFRHVKSCMAFVTQGPMWFNSWPFYPLIGGHLEFPKGHLTIPKRSPAELPGYWWLLMIDVLVLATFYHSFVSCSILILVDTIED